MANCKRLQLIQLIHLIFSNNRSIFCVLLLLELLNPLHSLLGNPLLSEENNFVGSNQCTNCHKNIFTTQINSGHARTLRKVESIPELLKAIPLQFFDKQNNVKYQIEKSPNKNFVLDLIATKENESNRMHLLWGLGAGRKGVTFVGLTDKGNYGQSRVSWYQKTSGLDVTTGLEKQVEDTYEALADWMSPPQQENCFACHTTQEADLPPIEMNPKNAGVHCERCHGPGEKHIQAMMSDNHQIVNTIKNPGKMKAIEQIYFCGACHGVPAGGTDLQTISKHMGDKQTARFPGQRLVFSRCYTESKGKLQCITCHDPHEDLVQQPRAYDTKCLTCHQAKNPLLQACPISKKDCTTCHMPYEKGFMTHSEFADHWIRILSENNSP
ncbi:MAG: hypothetical protein MK025_10285 [Acidobacteriia bacterium]|nr:hypothetical protein [Terriglobia bacterium]